MRTMETKMWQKKRSNEQNNSWALMFRTLFMLSLYLAIQQREVIKFGMVCVWEHTLTENYFSFNMELNVAHTHYAEVEMWHCYRDSKKIHAVIQEIPTKNIDLFFINLSSRHHSPDWLRSLLILPVQCLLTSRKCYCEIKFI